jgi:phosphate transport system protein
VDAEAIRLITVYSPIAKDLRALLVITRINSELERIGDQAVNICEYTKLLETNGPLPPLDSVNEMSTMAQQMLRDAQDAFRDEDVERARAVIGSDERMDAMNATAFRDFLERARVDAAIVTPSMRLILAGTRARAHCRPRDEHRRRNFLRGSGTGYPPHSLTANHASA